MTAAEGAEGADIRFSHDLQRIRDVILLRARVETTLGNQQKSNETSHILYLPATTLCLFVLISKVLLIIRYKRRDVS